MSATRLSAAAGCASSRPRERNTAAVPHCLLYVTQVFPSQHVQTKRSYGADSRLPIVLRRMRRRHASTRQRSKRWQRRISSAHLRSACSFCSFRSRSSCSLCDCDGAAKGNRASAVGEWPARNAAGGAHVSRARCSERTDMSACLRDERVQFLVSLVGGLGSPGAKGRRLRF